MNKPAYAEEFRCKCRAKKWHAHMNSPKVPAGSCGYEKRSGKELTYLFEDLFSVHVTIIPDVYMVKRRNLMRYTGTIEGEQI